MYLAPCKRAPICTSISITTPTKPSWTSYSTKERKSDQQRRRSGLGNIQAKEIRRLVRRRGRQHRLVHGRQDRQRLALSRLRYSRYRHAERIRRNCLPARAREIAECSAACGL